MKKKNPDINPASIQDSTIDPDIPESMITISINDDILNSNMNSNVMWPMGGSNYNQQYNWPISTTIPTSIWTATNTGQFNVTPNSELILSRGGKEIVKVEENGTVLWPNGVVVNEAAEALADSLVLGAEIAAGITDATKSRIRDSVFESIIEIAEEKGSLTAEDLRYFLKSSKIIEKLKKVE